MENVSVWDDAPWAPLPALADDVETDVCVVGLGGSGLTAVHELLELGVRVEALLPELAGRVRTARLQMLATAPTDEVSLPRPVYLRNGYEYVQRLPDGRVALGGFRDAGGDAEWKSSGLPSAAVQERLERFLRDDLGVSAPITHR